MEQQEFKEKMKKLAYNLDNQKLEVEIIDGYETYKQKKVNVPSCYVYGNVGSGKTYNVSRIKKHSKYIKWTEFYRQLNEDTFNQTKNFIKTTNKILIIDDLGTSKWTDFSMELLFEIVDYRLENNLITFITSNYSLNELKQKMDFVDRIQSKRIISRLNTYEKVHFNGKDLRKNK